MLPSCPGTKGRKVKKGIGLRRESGVMFHLGAVLFLLLLGACGGDDDASSDVAPNSLIQCAADKLAASADYCAAAMAGDGSVGRSDLVTAWRLAEEGPGAEGLSCSDLALRVEDVEGMVAASRLVLEESVSAEGNCGAELLSAAADLCSDMTAAEGRYLIEIMKGSAKSELAARRESARRSFLPKADRAVADGCATDPRGAADAARVEVDRLVDEFVTSITSAAHLDSSQYTTLSPSGAIEYGGKSLTPMCMDGSPYHFFARRGTVNKLVMYYQGGGACWEKLTCSVPACDTNVDVDGGDNPNNRSSGFADRDDSRNPFRDWHTVFVSYCGCDIHFGDAAQDYAGSENDPNPLHVEHRGFHNARAAEKWAREHFIAPETVFVTGSSAGAYGAWFHGPLLHDAWPAADFHILADAGNGVITEEFLDESFPNWNFEGNLPDDIPEVRDVLDQGLGITGYTEVIAKEFPETNWAHYSTAFDGGAGGQTGFYNIMLNDNNPIDALTWWEGSCAFNRVMREQVFDIADTVPDNYRYYIGTGSRHTMWGSPKVFDDTTGGVPTITSWINAMLNTSRASTDSGWTNVECEDCGLTLAGDPQPDPLQDPFGLRGDDVVIVCE